MHKINISQQLLWLWAGVFLASGIIYYMAQTMMPLLFTLVLAYLCSGLQAKLERRLNSRALAAGLITGIGWLTLIWLLFFLSPQILLQLQKLIQQLPGVKGALMNTWGQLSPVVSTPFFSHLMNEVTLSLTQWAKPSLQYIVMILPSLFSLVIYFFLVPLMLFLLLKDRHRITKWFVSWLPNGSQVLRSVWFEVDQQFGHYLKGKSIEVFIVALVSMLAYSLTGFKYALLLGFLGGISVLIPILGAIMVTVPLVVIGLMQWGWQPPLFWLLSVHGVILLLDAQLLTPWLFSHRLALHPLAILVAILFFGSVGGFWGLLFAIPLAILVKALIHVHKEIL